MTVSTVCAECGYELEWEDVLAGRRLCLACRTDHEIFRSKWQRQFLRCSQCDRIVKRGFCSWCYWRRHRRSRRYEPMDPNLKKLKNKRKKA